jgi:hypothetical protein
MNAPEPHRRIGGLPAHAEVLQRRAAGDLQILDADQILSQFMAGSTPDPVNFAARLMTDRNVPARAVVLIRFVRTERCRRAVETRQFGGRDSARDSVESSLKTRAVLAALRIRRRQFLQAGRDGARSRCGVRSSQIASRKKTTRAPERPLRLPPMRGTLSSTRTSQRPATLTCDTR